MLFAKDENGIRMKPTFSGQRAICELCGDALIGKCGEIYVHHWQHASYGDCDPWKEHETPWHREWKNLFPEECREVVMGEGDEKHRADVLTRRGLVIEFQHSSISRANIRIREEFYGKMIWVIDAEPFLQNIRRSSIVKRSLDILESEKKREISILDRSEDGRMEELKARLECIERDRRTEEWKIEESNSLIVKVRERLVDITNFAALIIDEWEKYGWHHQFDFHVPHEKEDEYKRKLKEQRFELRALQESKKKKEGDLATIRRLESVTIAETSYRIVPYGNIRSQNFAAVVAMSKASKNSMFPETISFTTESHFQSFRYKTDQYDFLLDLRSTETSIKNEIEEIDASIGKNLQATEALRSEITAALTIICRGQIGDAVRQLGDSAQKITAWETETAELEKKELEVAGEWNAYAYRRKEEIEAEHRKQKFETMRRKKGLFRFTWKHERPSWSHAEAATYFDLGDGYLHERIGPDLFQRITKEEFLLLHS